MKFGSTCLIYCLCAIILGIFAGCSADDSADDSMDAGIAAINAGQLQKARTIFEKIAKGAWEEVTK